jgi:hypothetical protein
MAFISNSRTYTSLRGVRYKTFADYARETKFWMLQQYYYLFLEHDAHKLLLYNILKRNTIEGGLQSGNLKIVLIVLLYNKMGYFRPIITT